MPRDRSEADDTTDVDIKNLINYLELIHKFPSNGKYLYGRSHIQLVASTPIAHPPSSLARCSVPSPSRTSLLCAQRGMAELIMH